MTLTAVRVLGLLIAVFWASGAAGEAGPKPETRQPYEAVRSIEAIQDQVVLGNVSARARLPKMVEQLAERLLAADRELWRDPRNAHAAVIYTLSGGSPRVAQKVIEIGLSAGQDLDLLRGALAYVQGRDSEAKKILQRIDAATLPPLAGAHVAMIEAALIAKDDPRAAIGLLDRARIMAPGTLVEETALRRALVLADGLGDIDKFIHLSNEYIWRFPKSAYFEAFRQHFASAAIHFCFAAHESNYAKIEDLAGRLDPATQLRLYLQIARKGLIEGKVTAAKFAASKAVELSADGTAEHARSRLYEAAAFILTDQFQAGLMGLRAIDAASLPKQDIELKEAVAALAARIGEPPGKPQGNEETEPAQSRHSPDDATRASASASTLIGLAQQNLSRAAEVLERNGP